MYVLLSTNCMSLMTPLYLSRDPESFSAMVSKEVSSLVDFVYRENWLHANYKNEDESYIKNVYIPIIEEQIKDIIECHNTNYTNYTYENFDDIYLARYNPFESCASLVLGSKQKRFSSASEEYKNRIYGTIKNIAEESDLIPNDRISYVVFVIVDLIIKGDPVCAFNINPFSGDIKMLGIDDLYGD